MSTRKTSSQQTISQFAAVAIPVGLIVACATDVPPIGWVLCYGQAISRSTYSRLFSVIGTVFGAGDGSTTFNVPDCRGRVFLGKDDLGGSSANRVTDSQADNIGQGSGVETHTLTTGQIPSHTHAMRGYQDNNTFFGDLFAINNAPDTTNGETGATGGGGAHNNVQPYQTAAYMIKS